MPHFASTLCGPDTEPCRILVDETIDATPAFRNGTPALATDAQGRPHVIYYTAEGSFVGFYALRAADGWQTETMPMPVATP